MEVIGTIGNALAVSLLLTTFAKAESVETFLPGQDLAASSSIVPSVNGKHGWSGFSFVVEFASPKVWTGPVVSKPGVFDFEISGEPDNRVYMFRVKGRYAGDPTRHDAELSVNAETDPSAAIRVAGICTYYFQPEQSRIGYRLSLYLDGELIGSRNCNWFLPDVSVRKPLVFASGIAVRSVGLGNHAFSLSDLFPEAPGMSAEADMGSFDKWSAVMRARATGKEVRFLGTDSLVLAVASEPFVGNPILGGWNRAVGEPLLAGDGLAWELEYAGTNGTPRRMRSNSRNLRSTVDFRNDGFTVMSDGNGFKVRHDVAMSGGRIERRLEVVDGVGSRIRNTVFPRVNLVRLPGKDILVEPQFSGVIASNPTLNYHHVGMFPEDKMTMQFVGYYNDRGDGVYFAAEDSAAVTKTYTSDGFNGRLMMEFSVTAPRDAGASGAKRFSSFGSGVLELYRGNWFEAGRVYRKFLEKSVPWYVKSIPRTDTPEWFMRNPLWIVNLNLKHGRKVAVRSLCSYFDVQTSFVTGLVKPPDGIGWFGPNYVINQEAMDCCRELQKEGVHFVAYTNPRLWYAGVGAEKSNGFSKTGERWAIRDEHGVAPVERYGNGNDYVDPCPGVAPWRKYLCDRTRMLAMHGLDGIYHDQMPTATPHVCFASDHGHAAGDPAVWESGGLWKFCAYLMGDLRHEFPNLVHTGEEASEPLVNCIDGFVSWRFGRSGHVPLFQSLYSPRIQFVGRGCDVHRVPGSYEGFFPKYAEQLAYGEQIGWVSYQTVSYPSPRRGFLKKLAHCRRDIADFMNSAEMEAPLGFAAEPEKLSCMWGVIVPNPVTTDKVLHSVWRHVDGRRLVMFLNTVNAPQEVKPLWTYGGKTFEVCRETSDKVDTMSAAPKSVRLAPYGFEFWFVGANPSSEAKTLARTLTQASKFPWKDRGPMLSLAPAFGKVVSPDARDGKPVRALDAAWGCLAYIPGHPHFDNHLHTPAIKDGWIATQDGGLVSYGTVDFGMGAKSVEFNLATDETGVKVELFDVTGDMPDRKIAEFYPKAGDWHGYKTYISPLFGATNGKRDIICRVTGGICNLKNWKLLESGTPAPAKPIGTVANGKIDFTGKWSLFARRNGERLEMSDGSYAYCGEVDFGKKPAAVEFEVDHADSNVVIEMIDVSEFAPSTPLARVKPATGKVSSRLSFKVEGKRSIVLMAKGGACTLKDAFKVLEQ